MIVCFVLINTLKVEYAILLPKVRIEHLAEYHTYRYFYGIKTI